MLYKPKKLNIVCGMRNFTFYKEIQAFHAAQNRSSVGYLLLLKSMCKNVASSASFGCTSISVCLRSLMLPYLIQSIWFATMANPHTRLRTHSSIGIPANATKHTTASSSIVDPGVFHCPPSIIAFAAMFRLQRGCSLWTCFNLTRRLTVLSLVLHRPTRTRHYNVSLVACCSK